jgi:hypothetical protein
MLDRLRKQAGHEGSPHREGTHGPYKREASALLLARLPPSLNDLARWPTCNTGGLTTPRFPEFRSMHAATVVTRRLSSIAQQASPDSSPSRSVRPFSPISTACGPALFNASVDYQNCRFAVRADGGINLRIGHQLDFDLRLLLLHCRKCPLRQAFRPRAMPLIAPASSHA